MAGEYRTEDVLNQLPAELAGMIRLADCASRWRGSPCPASCAGRI